MDTTEPPKNIIWIFGDQHRAQAMGHRGDPNLHTPNMDRLSVEGVNFTQAVGGCPLCCPFRGSLLSGLYPNKAVHGHEVQLDPSLPTVATVFNEAGYDTAYFGKWHVDGHHERDLRGAYHIVPPERRGDFKTWLGYENNNSQWDCWVHGGEGDNAVHYKLPGYETDALTDLFIDDLKKKADADTPFFSVLSVQPPHNPYAAPEEFMGMHNSGELELRPNVPDIPRVTQKARKDLAGYYAMIENFDWNIGRIRQALDDAGLTEDTWIFFFSDHGDMHGSHGQFLKTSPWEESIRVPCILAGGTPYYKHGCGDYNIPMNHVDYAPTSLGLCGIDVPDWMMGTDYSGLRLKKKPEQPYPESAYLQLVTPTCHGYSTDRPWRGVVTRDGWKYIVLEGQPLMMYNLNEDPYEQANLAHNSIFWKDRRRLHGLLEEWIEKTEDDFQLPTEN
ncbi:sulfatase [Kiritimatiellaeota bacterium B1221]|nr:sulfatase [Kiritimatiellaeota bacterium B1221]